MQLTYNGTDKERLDKFLTKELGLSRSRTQKFILENKVTVNTKTVTVHHWLKNGDIIEGSERAVEKKMPKESVAPMPQILYKDPDIAVVIKPAGLLIHPTEKNEKTTLAAWAIRTFPAIAGVGDDPDRPGLVHRLDKDVGGLVLLALNQESFKYLKNLFQERKITKKYYCLVHGGIQQHEGVIDTPVDRNKESGRMVAQTGKAGGKDAITRFDVIKRFHHYALLDVLILTGRTHQIRTHLFSVGHSIVGDPLYQTRDVRTKKRAPLLDRPFLFAYHIDFMDRQGEKKTFTVPLPPELQKILDSLTPQS